MVDGGLRLREPLMAGESVVDAVWLLLLFL